MRKYKSRESGFTYVEVIVSLCVATLIVGPLSYALLTSIRTRVNATHIDAATSYAEEMMESIQEKMTLDIKQKYGVEKKRIDVSSWSPEKKELAVFGAGKYLLESSDSEISTLPQRPMESLKKLLGEDKDASGNYLLDSRYYTDQYAYEVALWRMEDVTLDGTHQFTVNSEALKKATKFYTDNDTTYQFPDAVYGTPANPITFTIEPKMLKIFKDTNKIYTPHYSGDEKILDVNTIHFTAQDEAERINSDIRWDPVKSIEAKGGECGKHYNITYSGSISANKDNYTSIIKVDLSALLKGAEGVELPEETYKDNGYTLKFTNTTDFDQVIRINHNLKDKLTTNAETIYKRFNIVAEDKGAGKTTISYENGENPFENYIIAIVVREKNPVQGGKGKIVKKMIDVYSYDVSVS